MADIFIEYKGRGIKDKRIKTITTNNIKSVIAEFKFDEQWDEYVTKIALFAIGDCITYKDYLDNNNQCIVPWEILEEPNEITVSVAGITEEKTYNSVLMPIKIYPGGDINAESPHEPSQGILAQIELLRIQLEDTEQNVGQLQEKVLGIENTLQQFLGSPDEDGNIIIYLDGGIIQ